MAVTSSRVRSAQKRSVPAEASGPCRDAVVFRLKGGQHRLRCHEEAAVFLRPCARAVRPLCPVDSRPGCWPLPAAGRRQEPVHSQEGKTLSCPFDGCTRTYVSRAGWRQHIRLHTGKGLYACTVPGCTKRYTSADNLRFHLWGHTGKKPYSCPIEGCSESFRHRACKKEHLLTHTGEKSWICPVEGCRQQSVYASNLYAHMRTHTGERPYPCPFDGCTRRFRQKTHMNAHRVIHTRNRPYPCLFDGCGLTFRQQSGRAAHLVRSHGHKPLKQGGVDRAGGPPGSCEDSRAPAGQSPRPAALPPEPLATGPTASALAGLARAQKPGLSADAPCRLTRASPRRGRRRLESVVQRLWRQSGFSGTRGL